MWSNAFVNIRPLKSHPLRKARSIGNTSASRVVAPTITCAITPQRYAEPSSRSVKLALIKALRAKQCVVTRSYMYCTKLPTKARTRNIPPNVPTKLTREFPQATSSHLTMSTVKARPVRTPSVAETFSNKLG